MPYDIVWEPDGVRVDFSGEARSRELIESTERMESDPRFDEMRYVINDLSSVSGNDFSEESLTQLAVINFGAHASHPNCRMAYVTTNPELTELIKKTLMAEDMKSYTVEVLPSVEAARDWLDSQPELHLLSDVMGFRNF